MSKPLKIILSLVGLFVVLVLAAVIIVPLVVDPNDYRDEIARTVEEDTGRSFEIEGDISLSVFPWLGLEIGRTRLGNPPGFGSEDFAEIGSAAVGAKLLPLLFSRRLEISTLRLDGLRLNLLRLADGKANWEGFGGDADAPAPEARGDGLRIERVDGLRLTDALIRFEDRQAGSVMEASIPRLSTGGLAPGRAFPVEAEAELTLDEGKTRVAANLDANLDFAEDFSTLAVKDLSLEFTGPAVAGGPRSGRLAAPQIDLDVDGQSLEIPELSIEVAGVRARVEVSGASIVDDPSFTGRLGVEEFSPRALLERLGETVPQTADAAVFGKASMGSRFRFADEQVEFDELRLLLDDTTLTGTASLGLGETTRIRSQLDVDDLDLDRYLPPEDATTEEDETGEDTPLAFEWLEGLDLDASLRIDKLKISGLILADTRARAVAADGVLTLQPITAGLYGGRLEGNARLDARRSPATLSLQQSLSALQLQPFVQDLADFDRLTGTAKLGATLTTTATSTAELMSGLNGELDFEVADGAWKGVNLWFEIQRAWAVVKGRPAPQKASADTDFRQIKGTAEIRDGVLRNDDLVGGLPFLGLAGRGQVNLAESKLDYQLTATVIRQAVDEATGEASELAGASIPLKLSGGLDSPSVKVDLGSLVRDRAGEEALKRLGIEGEEGQSAEDALKDRAKEKVRDRLKRALGGD
jgi:AsmA protein